MSNANEVRQVFFKFYDDYAEGYIKFMSGEQVKKLLLALVDFHRDGVVAEFDDDPLVGMAYTSICNNMVRDEKKYRDTCRRNAEAYKQRKAQAEQESKDPKAGIDIFGL